MEYGYEITDTAGNKTFFVEGCTCCSMSTGGLHEINCPCNKDKQYKLSPYNIPSPQQEYKISTDPAS